MNVLQFADEDFAGVASKIRAALNGAGHSCRLVREHDTRFKYPGDIVKDARGVSKLIDAADVIIAHVWSHVVPRWGRARRVLYVHGTAFRRNPERPIAWCKRMGVKLVCSTLDLTRHDPQFLVYNPTPIDGTTLLAMARKNQPRRGPLRVAHSPSARKGKGTAEFLAACAGLRDVEPVIIENVDNAECLRIKSTCHASFDAIEIGCQVSGIEAMAMGLPVLAGGDKYVIQKAREYFGFQPYAWVRTAQDIMAQLVRLRDDPVYFDTWRNRALKCVGEFHDYPAAARRMMEWL